MILSGREIVKHIGKEIIIEPFDPKRVNPNSYNLSLANELLVYDEHVLDMKKPNTAHRIEIPEDGRCSSPTACTSAARTNTPKPTAISPCWRGVPRPDGSVCSSM